jgi:hypothetical protein
MGAIRSRDHRDAAQAGSHINDADERSTRLGLQRKTGADRRHSEQQSGGELTHGEAPELGISTQSGAELCDGRHGLRNKVTDWRREERSGPEWLGRFTQRRSWRMTAFRDRPN